MPFLWKNSPQLPQPPEPIVTPTTAVTYKVDQVANTVNWGGTLLYNTANTWYDVVYPNANSTFFSTLNVGDLYAGNIYANYIRANSLDVIDANITNLYNVTLWTSHVSADPTDPLGIASKQYVDAAVANGGGGGGNTQNVTITIGEIGEIGYFANTALPNGFLRAVSQNVSRTTYANLFNRIGTTYGEGDGNTTFTLPTHYAPIEKWRQVPDSYLPVARKFHTTNLLNDNRLIVVGGTNTGVAQSNVFFGTVDFERITWIDGTPLTSSRLAHASVVLGDGRILVTGGYDTSSIVKTETYFGTVTGNAVSWAAGTALPVARAYHTINVLGDGRVLVVGGIDGSSTNLATAIFGTISGTSITWASGTSMPQARYSHGASILSGGEILVTGGRDLSGIRNTAYIGTIAGTTIGWSTGTALPNIRAQHTQTTLGDGTVLVTGGTNLLNGSNGEVWVGTVSGTTITWADNDWLPNYKVQHSATLLPDGRVVLVGGSSLADVTFGTYRGNTFVWFPRPIYSPLTLALRDGRILQLGGYNVLSRANVHIGIPTGNTIAWQVSNNLPSSIYVAAATQLSDNRVMVTGGYNSVTAGQANVYIGTISTNNITWVTSNSLPATRYGHTMETLPAPDNRVIVVGGVAQYTNVHFGTVSGNNVTWDNAWSPLPAGRYYHTMAMLPDGRFFVIGGADSGGITRDNIYMGNVVPNTNNILWTTGPSLNEPLLAMKANTLADGRIIVTGGLNGNSVYRTNSSFIHVTGNTWSVHEALAIPGIRAHHSIVRLDDERLCVLGGVDGSVYRGEPFFGKMLLTGIRANQNTITFQTGGGGGGSGLAFVTIEPKNRVTTTQANVVADATEDVLTIKGGKGVIISSNASNDMVEIYGVTSHAVNPSYNSVLVAANTWTQLTFPSSTIYGAKRIIWSDAHSKYVVSRYRDSDNMIMTSTDGVNWKVIDTPAVASTKRGGAIAYSPELGLYVTLIEDTVGGLQCQALISTDTENWVLINVAGDSSNHSWYDITWSPSLGLFAAVAAQGLGSSSASNNSQFMTSPDGITWTLRTSPKNQAWKGIDWSPALGQFCAVAVAPVYGSIGQNNQVAISSDGITWTGYTTPNTLLFGVSNPGNWYDVAWCPGLSLYVAVGGSTGFSYTAPNYTTNSQLWLTSADGFNWTRHDYIETGTSANGHQIPAFVCWSPTLGRIITTSGENGGISPLYSGGNTNNFSISTSTDGTTWTFPSEPMANLAQGTYNQFHQSAWSPTLGKFLTVGYTAAARQDHLVSTTGTSFDLLTPSMESTTYYTSAYSEELGKFLLVGGTSGATSNTPKAIIAARTSTDAQTWTYYGSSTTTPYRVTWNRVIWSPEKELFVAVGDAASGYTGGLAATSPNGETWTIRTTPTGTNYGWSDVVWCPEISLFVATNFYGGLAGQQVMTSPDGITWTARTTPVQAADFFWWDGLAWSPELGLIVAVAQEASETQSIMTSPNGITWTARATTGMAYFMDVAWSPDLRMFAATCYDSGTFNPAIATSPDGINWTKVNVSTSAYWYGIAWSPEYQVFLAVGADNLVIVSNDGVNWIAVYTGLSGFNLYYKCTWSADYGIFLSSASNKVIRSNTAGIWRTITRSTQQSVNVSAVSVGVLPVAHGGTGHNAVGANGLLLIGNSQSSGFDLSTLTAGSGVTITNEAGTITISATGGGGGGNVGNVFTTINVAGQANVVADSNNDTLIFGIGPGIAITTNAVTDTITWQAAFNNTAPINLDQTTMNISHALSGVAAGTYGNSSYVASITVDETGHVTSVTNTLISGASTDQFARDQANAAYDTANSAALRANTLVTDNVPETTTNLYFTAARVRANISNTNPINYDSTTGIISHAASGVAASGYGSATQVPVVVVDANGHVTSVTNTTIVGANAAANTAAAGALQFNNSGYLGASANLVWDNANNRVGIGLNEGSINRLSGAFPAWSLDINANTVSFTDAPVLFVTNSNVGGLSGLYTGAADYNLKYAALEYYNESFNVASYGANAVGQSEATLYNGGLGALNLAAYGLWPIKLFTNDIERMRATPNGNVFIGFTGAELTGTGIGSTSRYLAINGAGDSFVAFLSNNFIRGYVGGYDGEVYMGYANTENVSLLGRDVKLYSGAQASTPNVYIAPVGTVVVNAGSTPIWNVWGDPAYTPALQVQGDLSAWRLGNDPNGPDLNFVKSRGGSPGVPQIVQNGDELFYIAGFADNSNTANANNYWYDSVAIYAKVDGVPTPNLPPPGALIFATQPGDSLSFNQERMRITANGDIGIGNATPYHAAGFNTVTIGGSTGAGQVVIYRDGTPRGWFWADAANGCSFEGDRDFQVIAQANIYFTANAYAGVSYDTSMGFFSNASYEAMHISALGRVGIHNNAPGHALTVTGDSWLDGALYANNSVGAPGALLASNGTNIYWAAPTANGQLPIGNTVSGGFDIATLTAGPNITITNAKGSITIEASSGAATDQFARDQANGAYTKANSANIIAQAAYNSANLEYGFVYSDTTANGVYTDWATLHAAYVAAGSPNTTIAFWQSVANDTASLMLSIPSGYWPFAIGSRWSTVRDSVAGGRLAQIRFESGARISGIQTFDGVQLFSNTSAAMYLDGTTVGGVATDVSYITLARGASAQGNNSSTFVFHANTDACGISVDASYLRQYSVNVAGPNSIYIDVYTSTQIFDNAIAAPNAGASVWFGRYDLGVAAVAGPQTAFNGTVKQAYDLVLETYGTTAARPAFPGNGAMYYDSTIAVPVWWNVDAWQRLVTDNVPETTTNLYFTAARVRANISNTNPINYDSTTGIISHAASGVTASGYGSATQVPVFVVDANGHITSVTNTAIAGVPASANTAIEGAIQFNNGGNLGGSANLVWDNANNLVGIGTTQPTAKVDIRSGRTYAVGTPTFYESTLEIAGAMDEFPRMSIVGYGDDSYGPLFIGYRHRGNTYNGTSNTITGDIGAWFEGRGYANGAGGDSTLGLIQMVQTGEATSGGVPGAILFFTSPGNVSQYYAPERMRITSNGQVGVNIATPTANLHIVGTSQITGSEYIDGTSWIQANYLPNNTTQYATIAAGGSYVYFGGANSVAALEGFYAGAEIGVNTVPDLVSLYTDLSVTNTGSAINASCIVTQPYFYTSATSNTNAQYARIIWLKPILPSGTSAGFANNYYGLYVEHNPHYVAPNNWPFYYTGNTGINPVVVTGNSQLGIGTDTPQTNLSIQNRLSLEVAVDATYGNVGSIYVGPFNGDNTSYVYIAGGADYTNTAGLELYAGGGNHSDHHTVRFTSNNYQETVRITANGDVGIGTVPANTDGWVTLALGSSAKKNAQISMFARNGTEYDIWIDTANAVYHALSPVDGSLNFIANTITFQSSRPGPDLERMRITTNGRVGIGTTTPNAGFEITKDNESGVPTARLTANDYPFMQWVETSTGNKFEIGAGGVLNDGTYLWNFNTVPMKFATGAIERLRITPNGNVIIGNTTQDIAKLWVEGDITAKGKVTSRSNTSYAAFYAEYGSPATGAFEVGTSAASGFVWNYMNGPIDFGTNNITVMTLANTGYMGLGSAAGSLTANSKLEIVSPRQYGDPTITYQESRITSLFPSDEYSGIYLQAWGNSVATDEAPEFGAGRYRGNTAVKANTINNDKCGVFFARGYSTGVGTSTVAQIDMIQAGDSQSTGVPGTMVFRVNDGLSVFTPPERMRIANTGYVGISNTTPAHNLAVSGTAWVRDSLTVRGPIIDANGTPGTSQQVLTSNGNGFYWGPAIAPKSMSVQSPNTADNITCFWTSTQMTFKQCIAVVQGTTPNVTYSLSYANTRATGTVGTAITGSVVVANTTNGVFTTSFSNATVPANNYVFLQFPAVSGTVTEFALTMEF